MREELAGDGRSGRAPGKSVPSNTCDTKVYAAANLPLIELLPDVPGRVLDCGCGDGGNARILRQRGWRVEGVTISPEEQKLAAEHCETVHLADLEQGLPPEIGSGFDVVLLSHVIEHLRGPERLLADAKRVLAPGGCIAVGLPNTLFFPYRLRLLRGDLEYERTGVLDHTHVHLYTFRSGADLLQENGFRVLHASASGFIPLGGARRILPGSLVRRATQWACSRFPGFFGEQSVYIAVPEPGERFRA